MNRLGLILAFYWSRETALKILRELGRNGYRRSAAIHKSSAQKVSIEQQGLSPWLGMFAAGAAGLLVGVVAGLDHFALLLVVLSMAPAGWLGVWLLRSGVDRAVLAKYSRSVLPDETLVIVEVPGRSMERVLDLLRRVEDAHPATFVVRPSRHFGPQISQPPVRKEPLTTERLHMLAAQLASTHRVVRGALRGQPLRGRLRRSKRYLEEVREGLEQASRLEQSITPAAEWILDNAYLVQGHITEVQQNLTRPYYKVLPVLKGGPQAGHPRVYGLAVQLIGHTDAHLDRDIIAEFLRAYQSIFSLTIGELWAVPLMLRLGLIENLRRLAVQVEQRHREREKADFWANRLLHVARREPEHLLHVLSDLASEQPEMPPHFAVRLTGQLYDEEAALVPVQGWLERKRGLTMQELVRQEQNRQAADLVSVANTISSLRQLSRLDWRKVFEDASLVEVTLRSDPAAVYARTDFSTRDRCRHVVEEISRRSKASEIEVARRAVDLANESQANLRQRHVGYYLIDRGRDLLEAEVGFTRPLKRRILRWALAHATELYLGSIGGLTLLLTGLVLQSLVAGRTIALLLLALWALVVTFPASDVATQIVQYLVALLLPPRVLPKMSFEEGIPDECRTLAVVPMMLLTPDAIAEEVERLEVRYLANPEPNLYFALLSDFADAPARDMPEDARLLEVAVKGIQALNERHRTDRFFLFHRERHWSPGEGGWIGWERKRGKLEELNCFLNGEPRYHSLTRVGNPALLRGIRFVITLDADTQLPHDTARRMIETLAHPLNHAEMSHDGRRVITEGYSIIQPRVTTSPVGANATLFTRIFTDPSGTDPYTRAVSDVYQDLFGEGAYHGKGIYDLAAFHAVLSHRFPEERLLSHDLLEGAHVRVALATDIELFDFFPTTYEAYAGRQHRWIRGDWQILEWILPGVPVAGGREANVLSAINRWKILDNLRRSLVPPATVFLLALGWLFSPWPGLASLLVGMQLLLPTITQLLSQLFGRDHPRLLPELSRNLLRVLCSTTLLPHQAILSGGAIARVLYRRFVNHRHLLEWETAQLAHGRASDRPGLPLHLLPVSVLVALFALLLASIRPAALPAALPFLVLWLSSPAVSIFLNRKARRPTPRLDESQQLFLRAVARDTWRYFDDFVGPLHNWLPPDNYQQSLRVELARRTSPTNIGLYICSALAAYDFGYLTLDEVAKRIRATLETTDRMERYNGHLLNWYDTQTLEPLRPRYVSSIDSGNLLASLWTLEQACSEIVQAPMLSASAFRGLYDTLAQFRTSYQHSESVKESAVFASLEQLLGDPPGGLTQMVRRLRSASGVARELIQMVSSDDPTSVASDSDTVSSDSVVPTSVSLWCYWAHCLEREIAGWNQIIDRYLSWVEVLSDPSGDALHALGVAAIDARRQALGEVPSLEDIASGEIRSLALLLSLRPTEGVSDELSTWFGQLSESIGRARWLAGEMLAEVEGITLRSRQLGDGMNLDFLFDRDRMLFTVGYNVSERTPDSAHYDLLASEARLTSFLAIARCEVPVKHWLKLARPFGLTRGQRLLLSWSGTMFEYLMPLLFQRNFPNSLLGQACEAAVAEQFAYARQRGIPAGISESAFSALDSHQIYQYRAFGAPGLGLKRGLEDDLVVAPYATALALLVDPPGAVKNLQRLAQLGVRGEYGYYEAIDFVRPSSREGSRGVVVRAYMAHHQGMTLLALDNALHHGIMQERFHRDPRVQATEPLLLERMPAAPPLFQPVAEQRQPVRLTATVSQPAISRFETADTPTPKTHLLSNGSYSIMVTNAGGGYSRWRDFDITRWRADTTRDNWGTFCYLRDLDQNITWSNTYHPKRSAAHRYAATFSSDRAEFHRRDHEIETVTHIVVSPQDDAEIRRLILTNRSSRTRQLELTTYAEIALAPHNSDRAHPAFSKLFVQTEALPERSALLAWRRPRSPEDAPVWAAHVLALEGNSQAPLEYETDRMQFLGRGRTAERPRALERTLSNSAGLVLDPVFSLRTRVSLEPDQPVQLAIITVAAESRERLGELIDKYRDLRATARALEMAWTHAQLEFRYLGIQLEDAHRFQQLASHLLYPNARLRAPADRLRRNTLGQSGLWPHGISGDLPIVTLAVADSSDLALVREILLAHTYWRVHGLKADLVILNAEAAGYEQPVKQQLMKMIQAHTLHTGSDQPGGVFLRSLDHLKPEDVTLLLAASRVSLVAARGSLVQQLSRPAGTADLPPRLRARRYAPEEPSAPLPFMELPYFNGLGGFTPDGREYAIYLGPDDETPLPWVNVMANPDFGTLVSESGCGFCWCGNSQANRLTPWTNDPISDAACSAIYIRDEESGVYWTPTPLPIRELDAYRARHGLGYTVFEHNSHAIEQVLVTFVPLQAAIEDETVGGLPLRISRLRLVNRSSRRRRLTVTAYADWTLGTDREETQQHIVTSWDAEASALLARNRYHPDFGRHVAFAALSPAAASFTADRTEFLGRNGCLERPAALQRESLSGKTGAGLDPCAALQSVLELNPGEAAEVAFLLGQSESPGEVRALVERFAGSAEVEGMLESTRARWDHLVGTLQVDTPDLAVNFLLNRWLLYQTLSCRIWARSGLYQSSGGFGFRDQLQDVMALLVAAPRVARERILRAARHQFVEGDVQHWWHPPSSAGVRTRCSDDLLWLPYVTAQYIRTTGDLRILDERVPFLEGPPLEQHEQEAYMVPTQSLEEASLFEHCRRAIEKGSTSGPHGLPLIGACDWNDGLNRVGVEGRGESVWLAWFLIDVLNSLAELADQRGEPSWSERWRRRADKLRKSVEREAWDGQWYLRCYYDDGTPLGSKDNAEAKIDSLAQSWAVLSGAAGTRARQAMNSVEAHLVRRDDKMVLLCTPPLDQSPKHPGYIKAYPAGVRENGGQYTHAALWVAQAFARLRDLRAVELLRMLNPVEHAREPRDVERYKVEPYVVAADIYALENQIGRGGWTWYTGSAGWMYRIWIEDVLGFKLRGDTLVLDPLVPADWKSFSLRYRHGTATYHISVEVPDKGGRSVDWIELDGQRQTENRIPLRDDGAEHRMRVGLTNDELRVTSDELTRR